MIATTLIAHVPSETNVYVGSPSIAQLPSGELIVSHDHFGPNSNADKSGRTDIYGSIDGGTTWEHYTTLTDAFWSSLFVHQGYLYLLGTSHEHGPIVIRQSSDGRTWTAPSQILPGQWHTAPVPIIEHNGRLWRGVEDAHCGSEWPSRYRARVLSVPSDGDLLNPNHWSISNALSSKLLSSPGVVGWLEGNVIHHTTKNKLCLLMRVETEALPNCAALISIEDEDTISLEQTKLVTFPGGTKKFTVRFDSLSGHYFALTNPVVENDALVRPSHIRNTLSLIASTNLTEWKVITTLLVDEDITKHGYQYADWIIDGEDLLAVVRTAGPYADDAAPNFHDSNQIIFCQISNFRLLLQEQVFV